MPNADKITIAQLLAHRSGVPNVKRDQNAQGNVNTLPITNDEHLDLIVKAAPDFEPGVKFLYSNSDYFLLGLIIEKLTGKSYETALQERIVKKIGLKDTYLATGNIDVNKNESLTYFILPGSDWKQVAENIQAFCSAQEQSCRHQQTLPNSFMYCLMESSSQRTALSR